MTGNWTRLLYLATNPAIGFVACLTPTKSARAQITKTTLTEVAIFLLPETLIARRSTQPVESTLSEITAVGRSRPVEQET